MLDGFEVSHQASCLLTLVLKHHVPDFEVAYQDGCSSRLNDVVSVSGARPFDDRHPRDELPLETSKSGADGVKASVRYNIF